MKANYRIVTRSTATSVNPGDTVKSHLFISGHGEVAKAKLFITYDLGLVNPQNPPVLRTCIKAVSSDITGKLVQPLSGKDFVQEWKLPGPGSTTELNIGYFAHIPDSQGALGQRMAESLWDELPPVLLELPTSKDMLPGDYGIRFVLTYVDHKEVLTDSETVKVHVNSFVERHGKILQISAVIGVAASIILGLVGLYLR